MNRPTAFISYSWDSDVHKEWVRGLAERLRGDGVVAVLDQWETQPGDALPVFMEAAIRDNDFVIVVCTPRYRRRSDTRQGGVGYEGDIMTGELLTAHNRRKFIPVLRTGGSADAIPSWLRGAYFVDLRADPVDEDHYKDLLTTVCGTRPPAPRVGAGQSADRGRKSGRPLGDEGVEPDAPIRILGVVVDEVTEPRLDGTRGSALYVVPFKLSRAPSNDWARMFETTWDHPPRSSTTHRPGICTVRGDRIVLDGTTIDEIERHHRETLVLVIDEVNRVMKGVEEKKRRQAEEERQRREQHRKGVEDAARRMRFDE